MGKMLVTGPSPTSSSSSFRALGCILSAFREGEFQTLCLENAERSALKVLKRVKALRQQTHRHSYCLSRSTPRRHPRASSLTLGLRLWSLAYHLISKGMYDMYRRAHRSLPRSHFCPTTTQITFCIPAKSRILSWTVLIISNDRREFIEYTKR